ncbi:DUF92 domain-containing protein [Neobacillus notoginsengisoli]|uniref:DUF92 domain-containing protein n=1 Tax=Neobacillus notoginsengisoli TaxID=1578198 RepID=UPI001F01B310|nr:DUF92 domain-containing protein [Neobacillus notoginsengisoli]
MASWAGWKLKSLTKSGALAAVATGFATLAGAGPKGLVLLGAFFATSSLWSKFKEVKKASIEEKLAKGSRRDWRQVAANGGPGALCSLLFLVTSDPIWIICFASAIASANSDTWASEIGSLSRREPVSILSLKRAERGTSGAVSSLGTLAAIFGSALISILAVFLYKLSPAYGMIIFLFGFIGNVLDTVMGAFFQALYRCKECGLETEKAVHCGERTIKIKGNAVLDNDMVNFLSGLMAAWGTFILLAFK